MRADLATLDLAGVFEALGHSVTEVVAGKYWAKCPWADEHSWTHRQDTVIWQDNGSWPVFHCSHDHCTGRKLAAVIGWAESKRPGIIKEHCSRQLAGGASRLKAGYRRAKKKFTRQETVKKVTPAEAAQNAEQFLGSSRVDEADLWHASAVYPGQDWRADSIAILEHLYFAHEFVCICTEFTETKRADGSFKAVPKGAGQARTAADWLTRIKEKGTPASAAGAWIRLNPVTEHGRGSRGAHTDQDVTAWRYLLVESDTLPIELQLSLYAKLAMPVAAIWTTGGISGHAIVRLSSGSEQGFRNDADFVLSGLRRFGFDQSNKNPSRYSRLPGALRSIGAKAGLHEDDAGQQRLLYLNPQPKGEPIFP
jgi:hypothetical protein